MPTDYPDTPLRSQYTGHYISLKLVNRSQAQADIISHL